jgi:hypothetical protein
VGDGVAVEVEEVVQLEEAETTVPIEDRHTDGAEAPALERQGLVVHRSERA